MKRILRYVTLVVMLPSAAGAQATAGDDLRGLWGAELNLGPRVRGTLTLVRGDGRWVMRVGGFEASAPVTGDSIRIELPGGQGTLRARLEPAQPAGIVAFWVQPAGNLSPYATPVRLGRLQANAWSGPVVPIDDRFSLYLQVQRLADGSLRGVIRNPERNWNGRAPWFRIERDRESVVFIDPAGRRRFVQPYDSAERRISFDLGGPVVLRPREPDAAVAFFPRLPSAPPYEYRVPLPLGDGWSTAPASSVGLDESRLAALVRRIATTDPATDTAPLIHSLLVARHGKLVLDEYFTGQAEDLPHDLRSASKTFVSVMAGIAMDRGAKFTMSTRVTSVFSRSLLPSTPDDRLSRVTVGQLLTHTSGFACDENDEASPGYEDTMQGQSAEPDWYRFILNVPMAHEPGTVYAYCSAGINLAGGVIARTTHDWLPAFFDRYIARPLQIQQYGFNLMPTGEGYGGGGMRLRSRDFLKFGQLYLSGGTWLGRRIVSSNWVRLSTSQQVKGPSGTSDGFGWHRNVLTAGGRTYQEYEANGNGGQLLMVIPELDLTVVFTAGNYNQYRIWRKFREELVPQYVFPAAEKR